MSSPLSPHVPDWTASLRGSIEEIDPESLFIHWRIMQGPLNENILQGK